MSAFHALRDEQWNQVEVLRPGQVGDPGRSGKDNRLFVDVVLFVAMPVFSDRDDRLAVARLAGTVCEPQLDLASV